MKKLFVALLFLSVCTFAIAHTVNWHVGDQIISTTTCNSGDSITPPTAPAKRGYHLKEWSVPYIVLEYIESTGTQYIDTGVQFSTTTNVEIEFQYVNFSGAYNDLFGVTFPSRVDKSYLLRCPGNSFVILAGTQFNIATADTNKHTLKVENLKVYFDGVLKGTGTSIVDNPINAYLFASHNEDRAFGEASARVYYFKIYDNDTLVRNFVPAKNSSGVVGMFDKVSGQFFYNQGTGEFIAGPEVGVL